MTEITLDTQPLTIEHVRAAAGGPTTVTIGAQARNRIAASRAVIEQHAGGETPIYGVNTGFGSLSRHKVAPDALRAVQRNLVLSHAAGVGDPLPPDIVRSMMLILAASLSRGHSGVRIELIEQIIQLINREVTPIVPSRGSVGASGDLAPLSHVAIVLIGEGEAVVEGERMSGAAALRRVGLRPIELAAREGLALINGTHMMTAIGCAVLAGLDRLTAAAVQSAALAIDACLGTDSFLDARVHDVRCQPGQSHVAARLREELDGSRILESHRENDPRVQDPYCLRATPQVVGAALDAIDSQRAVIERELGAVTDNPLVFPAEHGHDEAIISAANFHGMPIAIALDSLAIPICHLAGIAERRTFWVLSGRDTENPVHPHLSPEPGLHSGLMIAQYTAAACCNEIQTLCTPASVANIPTSAGIEDYNSMGPTAGHQAMAALKLARSVIAIELLVMAEALDYHRPLRSGGGVERTHELVRTVASRLTEDRPPAPDIEAIAALIERGGFA